MWFSISQFQKKFLIQLAVTFAIGLVCITGIAVFGGAISEKTNEISALRKEMAEWSASIRSFVAIKTQYSGKAGEYEKVLENIMPKRDELIDLKKDFQFLAAGEGLDLAFSFMSERETETPLVGGMGVSISVRGDSQEQIFSFLERLKKFRYLFSIDSLRFETGDKSASVSLKGEVLFRNY